MGTPIERKVTVTPGGNEKVDIPIKLRN